MSGHQRIVLVSSCGTSLLTNVADSGERKILTATANRSERDITPEERRVVDDCAARAKQKLFNAKDLDVARKLSAELNGVISFYGGQMARGKEDMGFLIHTDTYQGCLVVEVLREWLAGRGIKCSPVLAKDLNTASLLDFTAGMQEVIKWCNDSLPANREAGYRIVFNLTGGFKSLQGFLQTIGMFYADEIVYIFESGQELLRIPRLPVKLDVREAVQRNLMTFRLLGNNCVVDEEHCSGIPEALITKMEGKAAFSIWGDLVWKQLKREIYGEGLQEPLSPRLIYSEKFSKQVAALPKDRKEIINERMDDLSRCIDENKLHNPPESLGFKPIKGKSIPQSTHECYAWSDKDAKRCFGHFEKRANGEVFVIAELGNHL